MIRFNKPTIGKKDLESVLNCMVRDDLTPGDYLKTFSSMLSKELNRSNVAVFNTYFFSFESIFNILDAENGDEVILPSISRFGILKSIEKCRLKPVLVDLSEESFLPSFDEIKKKLSKKTCCIIVPQMFGIPYDLSAYKQFAIPLIEDMDGSVGSRVNGLSVGSFGDFVTLRFNDYSILTTGDGGMVASGDKGLKNFVQAIVDDHRQSDCLMSDFNASLGISQLKKLDYILETRKKIGEFYDSAVLTSDCILVGRSEEKELSFSSYVVKTETPFYECVRSFRKFGIPIRRGFDQPLHIHLHLDSKQFEKTEEMCNKVIALPIYPTLAQKDIENIVKGIRTIL